MNPDAVPDAAEWLYERFVAECYPAGLEGVDPLVVLSHHHCWRQEQTDPAIRRLVARVAQDTTCAMYGLPRPTEIN
jgi:hypothetical protein